MKRLSVVALVVAFWMAAGPDLGLSQGAPRCAGCRGPIYGEYVRAGDAYYHPEHFVCELCGKRLTSEYVIHEGRNYHAICYESRLALKCALCGKVIQGRYIKDFWGNAYHSSHEGKSPKCEYCSRFLSQALTGGGVTYEDGRAVCGICRRTAIDRDTEAAPLLERVASEMRVSGIQVDTAEVRLHLVGLPELKEKAGGGPHILRGYTDYSETRVTGMTLSRKIDVYVLHGMPREDAVATMAHELMHVWQSVRHRMSNDPAFSEGSCNYASYLVLGKHSGGQRDFIARNMMQSEDPVYGKGFRRVRRFAEEKGIPRWLDRLGSQDRLPPGY